MPIPAVPSLPCRKCGRRLRAGGTANNACFPFCSERCRDSDLGAWVDEEYRIPVDPTAQGGVADLDGAEDVAGFEPGT